MRQPLEKTPYLQEFERILKKYGYDTVYCIGSFDGTKRGSVLYHIKSVYNEDAKVELLRLVDPTWNMDEYSPEDCGNVVIRDDISLNRNNPIYTGGEFYAI